jgi:hypothetical protein
MFGAVSKESSAVFACQQDFTMYEWPIAVAG